MRLLLVEDDAELAARLEGRLRDAGFAVDVAGTHADAQDWPDLDKMAAIILDLNLPDGSGMDLLRGWRGGKRAGADCPVVILTARGSWQEKVEGLNAGADDFVVKPVRFEELLARLHAVLRRRGSEQAPGAGIWIERAGLRLDPVARLAQCDGRPLSLTRMEFRLLHMFLRHPGQVLGQGDILEHIYDLESERQLNAVEVLISRLRRKIGAPRIETVRGLGYRFCP